MPLVITPSPESRRSTRLGPCVSFHAWTSASLARRRRWAGRAWPGTITRPAMLRTKSGVGAPVSAGVSGAPTAKRGCTGDFEWLTRVVRRNRTGRCQRSLTS